MLVVSPNLVLLAIDPTVVWFVRGVLITGALIAALLAIFRRKLWIACLLILPCAALAPAEIFYISHFGRPSDANIIATVLESNLREADDFLGDIKIYLVGAMVICAFFAIATAAIVRSSRISMTSKISHWILALTFGVPAAAMCVAAARPPAGQTHVEALFATARRLSLETYGTYPFGVIGRIMDYRSEMAEMRRVTLAQKDFRFGATRMHAASPGRVFVLVIGESSRRNHWQLFGYDRPTNPELSRVKNLVPLTDVVTPWAASRLAVPEVVSRKPPTDEEDYFSEPSVVRLFGEAGFRTFWYSTQVAVSYFDSPISVIAFDAQKTEFFSALGTEGSAIHDDALLAPLSGVLAAEADDVFIILHTIGSHVRYTSRYPADFDRFDKLRPANGDSFARLENEYDNTILFTDHVLAQIIQTLENTHRVAALWYTSDHGEMLPTSACPVRGHGFPGLQVYPVPAVFWYSDEYAAAYPTKVETLRRNADAKVSTTNSFESLVDMADLEFPSQDRRKSLFSPDFTESLRIVNAATWVDFDQKVLVGECSVVTRPAALSK